MAVTHSPICESRRADIMAEILRYPSHAWSALNAPGNYLYDERDQVAGADLDSQCDDLRVKFQSVTDWRTAMAQLSRLIRLDERRRKISVAVVIDGRTILGEAV